MTFAALLFLTLALGTGAIGALQVPTLSLFLDTELKINSELLGLFYAVNALSGIAISLRVAHLSDKITQRVWLLRGCLAALLLHACLFAYSRHYFWLITLGVLLNALGSSAIPQLFAMAREYQTRPAFSALLRAQFSLAWIAGPPLAFWLIEAVGFKGLYLTSAVIVAVMLLLTFGLPQRISFVESLPKALKSQYPPQKKNLTLLLIASVFFWCCSALYIINFPLFLTQHLQFETHRVGYFYALAAGLEIPIMLFAAHCVSRSGKKRLMLLATLSGLLFFVFLSFSTSLLSLFVLQFFNAFFIALISTIGLFWFQDFMPDQQGMASTLFTNSVSMGVLLAGCFQGAIASWLLPHQIWWVAAVLLSISLVLISKVDNIHL